MNVTKRFFALILLLVLIISSMTFYSCADSKNPAVNTEAHIHEFEWIGNEAAHWQECKCGETSGLAAHAWNGGVVTTEPTAEAEGVKTYTCETCGAEKTEAVEKLPDNNDGENDPVESEPTGNDKKGCSNSISVGVGFMVIALSTALTFVFKKKED